MPVELTAGWEDNPGSVGKNAAELMTIGLCYLRDDCNMHSKYVHCILTYIVTGIRSGPDDRDFSSRLRFPAINIPPTYNNICTNACDTTAQTKFNFEL